MSQLDDIRARADAASEGPWHEYYVKPIPLTPYGDWIVDSEKTLIVSTNVWTDEAKADAVFIAHARQDVPRLLAALDAVLALHVPEPPVQLKNGFLDVEPNCAGCIADCWDCEGVHFYADCPVRKAITEALEAS